MNRYDLLGQTGAGIKYCAKTFDDFRGEFTDFGSPIALYDVVEKKMSVSRPLVFRGLHQQRGWYAQEKEVHLIAGNILDFVYNPMNEMLEVFEMISGDKIYVPQDCYHGFYSLEESTVLYDIGNCGYVPDQEVSLRPTNRMFNLIGDRIGRFVFPDKISEKDMHAELLSDKTLIKTYVRNRNAETFFTEN